MKHIRRIARLKDKLAEAQSQIEYNKEHINRGDRVVFFESWNRDLEFEIEAFEMSLKYYENDI
jgi:hypothetical protein